MGKAALSGKYAAYPEYKDSGVEWIGEIPIDWEMWKITHACSYVASGTTPKSDGNKYYGGENLWVTTGELREDVVFDTKKKLTDKALFDMPTLRLHPEGSVAIAMYGATIGRLGILGKSATTNQACCVMPPSEILHNKYLFYWLYATRQEIINLSSGGGQPNVNQEKISSLKVSSPDYVLQKKIANFLDHETAKIDTLIEKQQQLIKLLKEKRQAVISHAVTKGLPSSTGSKAPMRDSGVEWLGEVPEHWVVYKLKHACSEIFLGLTSKVDYVETNGVPLVRALNISGGILDLTMAREISVEQHEKLTKYRCATRDDVLLSKSGTIGTAAIVDTDIEFSIYESIFALRAIKKILLPEYLLFFIQSSVAKAQYARDSVGMGVHHLNMPDIQEVRMPIPPVVEQELILAKLRQDLYKFDLLISQAELSIGFIYERRTALISAAVTGKIDVRNWQAPEENNDVA